MITVCFTKRMEFWGGGCDEAAESARHLSSCISQDERLSVTLCQINISLHRPAWLLMTMQLTPQVQAIAQICAASTVLLDRTEQHTLSSRQSKQGGWYSSVYMSLLPPFALMSPCQTYEQHYIHKSATLSNYTYAAS
mmetsp:Transcript_9269/g.25075  ORF Transcript_9269/g.25075 Transcript_9269/m.25075 type:complete len:137 (+) Transcript_9269:391-801(+)